MADLTAIETNIVSTLQTVTGLKKTFGNEPKTITQLPAATLFLDGFEQEDNATRRKEVTWKWIVRLYVPLQDAEKAQTDIKTLLVSTLTAFRNNPTLGGTVLFQNVATGEIFAVTNQNNPLMMAEVSLHATVKEAY
ncbi:hypothetical protein [Effusibacillus consociatus]|uniref:DUF3168 domain-containing protein n=1 Tax=Effusibacillus consociatus TaxID=1117041 RepID=A0ABV9Q7W8_9BACL